MRERWAKIRGFTYLISNRGRVKSLPKVYGLRVFNSQILKPVKSGRYLFVTLYRNKKQYYKEIHRMVAIAFVSNPMKLPFVNHKNRNKRDNNYRNLEWCFDRKNASHHNLLSNKKTSRFTGVNWVHKSKKWRAQIQVKGKKIYLGLYSNESHAAKAYNDALKKYNLINKYSKF